MAKLSANLASHFLPKKIGKPLISGLPVFLALPVLVLALLLLLLLPLPSSLLPLLLLSNAQLNLLESQLQHSLQVHLRPMQLLLLPLNPALLNVQALQLGLPTSRWLSSTWGEKQPVLVRLVGLGLGLLVQQVLLVLLGPLGLLGLLRLLLGLVLLVLLLLLVHLKKTKKSISKSHLANT